MSQFPRWKFKTLLAVFILSGVFLWILIVKPVQAISHVPGDFLKTYNDTLGSENWNNLLGYSSTTALVYSGANPLGNFVNTWLPAVMLGPLGINAEPNSTQLTIKGTGGNVLDLLDSSGTNLFTVLNNGRVGIGTNVPNDTLSIGNSGVAPAGSAATGHNYTSTYLSTDNYALVNYGLLKTVTDLFVPGGSNTLWSGTSTADIWNSNSGNVGIGTSSPAEKLTVTGNLFVDLPTGGAATFTEDPAGATSIGKIQLGRTVDGWESISFDPTLGSRGKFVFTAPIQVAASSPGVTFYDPSDPTNTDKQRSIEYSATDLQLKIGDSFKTNFSTNTGMPPASKVFFQIGPNDLSNATSSGVFIGANPPSNFVGDLLHFQVGGLTRFRVTKFGDIISGGATMVDNGPIINTTQTWNNSVVPFTAWLMKITDTNSSSTSRLLDLQVNNSSKFVIRKDGSVGIDTTAPNDIFSIGNSGSAPAGSAATGHNYTSTYLSTDNYALTNYGLVKTLIAGGSGSSVGYWTMNGTDIYNSNAGNVGIGTTNPMIGLHVAANGVAIPSTTATPNGSFIVGANNSAVIGSMGVYNAAPAYFWIQPRDNAGATWYNTVLNPNGGNVGIGTTAPIGKLNVVHGTTGSGVVIDSTTGYGLSLWGGAPVGGTAAGFIGFGASRTNAAYYAQSTNPAWISGYAGYLEFSTDSGKTGTGEAYTPTARMRLSATGGLSLGSTYYSTDAGSGNMIIQGNVGIGVTNPGYKLEVAGAIGISGSGNAQFNPLADGGIGVIGGYNNTGTLRLQTIVGGAIFDRVTILNNGSVGIGTTAPNDTFSIGNSGAAPAGSAATGHNYTSTYLSTDNYALTNYGLVKTLIAGGSGSSVGYWTMNGTDIYNSNSGNVGIGTTNPEAKLDISGSVTANGVFTKKYLTDTGSGSALQIGSGYELFGTTHANGGYTAWITSGMPQAVPYNGGFGGGWNMSIGHPSYTNVTLSSTNVAIMGGNVGIGTTGPTRKFHVVESTNSLADGMGQFFAPSITTANYASIWIGKSAANGEAAAFGHQLGATPSTDSYSWMVNWGDAVATQSLILKKGGNVGIGTTNPAAKLDIRKSSGIALLTLAADDATSNSVINFETTNDQFTIGMDKSNNSFAIAHGATLETSPWFTILNNSGKVGIGTTAPNDTFSIGNSGAAPAGSAATGHNYTSTYLSTDNYALTNYGLVKTLIAGGSGSSVGYWTMNGTDIYNSNAGNVGVGTTNPVYKLDVSGQTRFQSPVSVGNYATPNTANDLYVRSGWTSAGANKTAVSISSDSWGNNAPYSFTGIFSAATTDPGPTNSALALYGGNFSAGHNGGTTLPNSYSIYVNPRAGYSAGTSATVVTNSYGAYITTPWVSNGASIVNSYGLYLENQNAATTKNYAIYSNGGINYFAGNVGIGMTAPGYKLELNNALGADGYVAQFTNDADSGILISRTNNLGGAGISFHESTSDYLSFDVTDDALPVFSTDTKMVITTAGNVGVGTTNPLKKLSITGSVASDDEYLIHLRKNAGWGSPGILFGAGNVATKGKGAILYRNTEWNWGRGDFYFLQNQSNDDSEATIDSAVMVIQNSGNVGIGTTAPNDTFSIGNSGSAPAGSSATGHNYTSTYLSTDNYALTNYGLVKTLIAGGSGSAVGYWTMNGTDIYNSNSGNVGIGTTSPTYLMDIVGGNGNQLRLTPGNSTWLAQLVLLAGSNEWGLRVDGSGTNFEISDRYTGGSPFVIKRGGNVGIGTTNPTNLLTLYKNANSYLDVNVTANAGVRLSQPNSSTDNNDLYLLADRGIIMAPFDYAGTKMNQGEKLEVIEAGNNLKSGVGLYDFSSQSTDYSKMSFYKSETNTIGTKTTTSNGSILGRVGAYGVALNPNFVEAGRIDFVQSTAGTGGSYLGGEIQFWTGTSMSSAISQKMVIDNIGNVGIGTTAPNDTFSIGNSGAAPAGSSATGHNYTSTYLSTDNYALTNYGLVKTLIAGGSGSSVGYWTMNGTNINNSNAGNVGVGTSSPLSTLEVNGTFKVGTSSSSIILDASGNILIGI